MRPGPTELFAGDALADLCERLAGQPHQVPVANPALQQPLADPVLRLLMSDSAADLERYLAQRGVVWSGRDGRRDEEPGVDDEENESRARVAESLKEKLLQVSLISPGLSPAGGLGGVLIN